MMREAATAVRASLKTIRATNQELIDIQKALDGIGGAGGMWQGSAAEAYASALYKLIVDVVRAYNNVESVPSDLEKQADDYDRAEGIAESTAGSIPKATWACV